MIRSADEAAAAAAQAAAAWDQMEPIDVDAPEASGTAEAASGSGGPAAGEAASGSGDAAAGSGDQVQTESLCFKWVRNLVSVPTPLNSQTLSH